MVSIQHKKHGTDSKQVLDPEQWLQSLQKDHSTNEVEIIRRACDIARNAHAGQLRASGEPFFLHSLAVANILTDLHMDYETLAAAILHDVAEDTEMTLDDIKDTFGDNISRLVDGVTKMELINTFRPEEGDHKQQQAQVETLRKMLLAMAEDVRVVMIKLADRTHNMRTLSALPREKQRRIARETLDIYAPLANRLGIWQIKWELEDLSFRYLDPALYKNIAKMLDERRVDREQYIKEVIEILQEALSRAGIKFEISGRPKHIFSIWHKMQRKNIDYHQVYDVRGIRILTNEISACYAALGIVHSLWQYIPGEFDDYIATPKENNYQSIHTAVIGPRGKTVEIQIRTHEMHKNNELGVAAHWRYKEGSTEDQVFDEKISWLRQLMEWKDEISDASDFVDQLKSDIFEDRIYVFTPKGKVIDLPKGSTPLDFAYQIHTEVGHHCRGAKVNGNMVPLTYQLKTGQQVDVLTVKNATPSRDWINPHRGYLKTNRAKNKVQHWFKQQDHEKNVVEGRNTLEKELKRLGLASVNFSTLATKYKFDDIDEFYGAIARGDIKTAHVINAAQQLVEPQVKQEIDKFTLQKPVSSENKQGDIQIQGIGNLLTNIANCCKPVPGDEIGGYITRGRGVTIHRSDCANMLRYSVQCPERVIAVNWGGDADNTYPVDVQIVAFDRQGLLRDITSILANEKINLIAANTISDKKDHRATMRLTLEISNISRLSKVVDKIDQLPNVIEVTRLAH